MADFRKLSDFIDINPRESLQKGAIAKKVAMEALRPFCRDIEYYEKCAFLGGSKFRNGDTIMARITPCLENGKTAMVDVLEPGEVGFGSTEFIVFRAKEGLADPFYVYYLICSSVIREPAIKSMVGSSGRQRVQTDVIANLIIPVHSFEEQRRIGLILKKIDDKIKLNNIINENLQQQAQAIFKEQIKSAKVEAQFTRYIKILGGGTPKTSMPEYWGGDIPFFTPKDVGSPYVLNTMKTITKQGLSNCNSRLYPTNTTFVTARGTVGKVSLAGVPMAMNQSCYALTSDTLHPILVYFYALEAVESLKHKASGAVFDAIVTKDFDTERIKLLSLAAQKELGNSLSKLFDEKLLLTKENNRLSELRDMILPKLMSGEIDPNH